MPASPFRGTPFTDLVEHLAKERDGFVGDLTEGRWNGEAEGKALVARIATLNAALEKAKTLTGPQGGFHEGEDI